MNSRRLASSTVIGVAGLVLGLAMPAAAHEARVVAATINGNTIKANTITGKQVKESTLSTVPRAKSLTPLIWHKLKLVHGWSTFAGATVGYAIDAQGQVHLRGLIHGGSAFSSAFTLPAAARPKVTFGVPVMAGSGVQVDFLDIEQSGPVTPSTATGGSIDDLAALTTLNGVVFSPKG